MLGVSLVLKFETRCSKVEQVSSRVACSKCHKRRQFQAQRQLFPAVLTTHYDDYPVATFSYAN